MSCWRVEITTREKEELFEDEHDGSFTVALGKNPVRFLVKSVVDTSYHDDVVDGVEYAKAVDNNVVQQK